jgi:nitroreductase
VEPLPPIGDPGTVAAVDRVLATTRSVRLRLDLTRSVEDQVLFDCIDLAEQAPTGGNLSSRRWMVVRDPATRAAVAELYRAAGGAGIIRLAERLKGTGHQSERVMTSGGYLAEHLQDVPAIVIACIWGEHDGSGRPGLFDSVLQSAWSFCLAARARGLGTAWTTVHLGKADEMAALLGIPEGVTQVVLLPVAYTVGTEFRPAARRPAREITYFDRWGYTRNKPSHDGLPHVTDELGVVAEVDVDATPAAVWALVSDITTPARVGSELTSAEWLDPGPAVGARFVGRNFLEGLGEWKTTCTVMVCDPPGTRTTAEFTWHVADPDTPAALELRARTDRAAGAAAPAGDHVRARLGHGGHGAQPARARAAHPRTPARTVEGRHAAHRRGHQGPRRAAAHVTRTGSIR